MSPYVRIALLAAVVVCGIVGCDGGSKDVVVQAPSEEERAAQLENLTPEQRQAMQAVVEAMRSQTQSDGAEQKTSE